MYDFTERKILITGSSRGIGRRIAEDFISLGARVLITGTNETLLREVKDELGSHCHYVRCNFSNTEEINSLFDQAVNKFGFIDTLINNAGITRDGLFLRMSNIDWMEVLNINLNSAFLLSQLMIKPMIKNRFGRIINISSIVGATGNAGQTNYAASKAAMVGFSKSLAIEVANRNITVNSIAPGYIQTEMTDKLSEGQMEAIVSRIPSKKIGMPKDVSNLAVFLSSLQAEYITGQTIHVNGGMYMS
ncbi:MAG: 3-oxoacyl-[acyl-carrier-protein] reductase [Paracoccaceae bacterium]